MYKGKVLGVYDEWPECQGQVEEVSGASHKGLKSRQEAEASYLRLTLARERIHNRRLMYCIVLLSLIVTTLLAYIIVLMDTDVVASIRDLYRYFRDDDERPLCVE